MTILLPYKEIILFFGKCPLNTCQLCIFCKLANQMNTPMHASDWFDSWSQIHYTLHPLYTHREKMFRLLGTMVEFLKSQQKYRYFWKFRQIFFPNLHRSWQFKGMTSFVKKNACFSYINFCRNLRKSTVFFLCLYIDSQCVVQI